MTKFCIQCGAALAENARFCGNCGAAADSGDPSGASVDAHFAGGEEPGAREGPNWLLIGGGGAILALLLLYYFLFLHDDMAGESLEQRVQPAPATQQQRVEAQYYAVVQANIRDKATTVGSNIIGKLSRASSVTGTVILGEDGSSDWLKLANDAGFVAMVNLAETAPPDIVKSLGDKAWTASEPVEIWSQPDTASTLLDRAAAGTVLTLSGLTANDFVEVKLKRGGVGYIADGARIAALANGKPIAIAFNPNSCSFGPEIDAKLTALGEKIRANYKAIEDRDYPSEEARAKALAAIEGRSSFERMERSFEGLTVKAIAQHYESQSVYFAEPAAQVIAAFRAKGYKIGRDGSIASVDLYAGIGPAAGEGARYGRSDLSCGV